MPESENLGATMQRLRSMPNECATCLPDAGWHFSYLGGVEAIDKKLKSFSHSEFSTIPRTVVERASEAAATLSDAASAVSPTRQTRPS